MIGDLIYSVELAIVRFPGDGPDGAPTKEPVTVRYCDICRRWGATDATHLCGRTWHRRLSDLLMELTRGERR